MNKMINFLKGEKGFMLSLLMLLISVFVCDAGVLMAEATVVAPAAEGTADTGHEGLNTQMNGQDGSVTNLEQAGEGADIIAEEIDEQISTFRTEFFPLDTIARKVARKSMRRNYEVKHFHIDSSRVSCETSAAIANASKANKVVLSLDAKDKNVFQRYATINVLGVNGYDEATGQIEQEGQDLMLYVVGQDSTSGMPLVVAINGPKDSADSTETYVPAIAEGVVLQRMAYAAAECQLFCPPSNATPVPTTVYMQRKLCNTKLRDYLKSIARKVAWDEQDINEQALWEFRRECEATYLFGRKGKILVNDPDRSTVGTEAVYFSGGIYWNLKKRYEYTKGAFSFNDLIGLTKMKFAGNSGSKTAFFGVGKDLLEEMLRIDRRIYTGLNITNITKWGLKFTSFESSFGTTNVIHMPMLDEYGRADQGVCLDLDFLVRYVMKDTESKSLDPSSLDGNAMIQTDCLALKGYSHLLVAPSAASSSAVSAISNDNMVINACKGHCL